jgi:hypothetical protein
VYARDHRPRFIVTWSVLWELIDCRSVDAAIDGYAAMRDAIERVAREGWETEGDAEFGFVFLRRGEQRHLLMLTGRDPRDSRSQSFNPFRGVNGGGSLS